MSTQTNVDFGFPLRLYSFGCEPKPKKSINYHSKTEFLEDVENAVGEEVWNNIRDSHLGVIVRFVENKFSWSSKFVHYLLVRQLVCKKEHEIWCLLGNTPVRFSLSEFEEITTLNCAPFPTTEEVLETNAHKDLWKKLKVKKKNPCKKELKTALGDVATWSTEDKIRFAYLSILATFIIGEDEKKPLPAKLARMVFDLHKFEKYPWGREAFKRLIESVKCKNLSAPSYTIDGFVQVLQIWAYNAVPSFGAKLGRPSNIREPALLKFKGLKGVNNIDIRAISIADENNIKKVSINHLAPIVWDGENVDKEIDSLLQAICKEEGLGVVTWMDHGLNNTQMAENIREVVDKKGEEAEENITDVVGEKAEENISKGVCRVGEEAKENLGEGDGNKTLVKGKTSLQTMSKKKRKEVDSSISKFVAESFEALHLRIEELEQQAKKYEAVVAQLEDMKKKLKSYEVTRLNVELLEQEVMLLREKSKTNEIFNKGYQLKDSSDEDTYMANSLTKPKVTRKKLDESDEESTVDGRYPMSNIKKEPMQKSPSIKIIQPTASLAEKVTQRKIQQTLKVMGTNNNTKIVREKSKRVTKPAAPLLTPFRSTKPTIGITKKINHPKQVAGCGYDPFASVDRQKIKVLDDWLQLDGEYPIGSKNSGVDFFKILRTPQDWLNEEHINSAMNMLRLRFMKNPKIFRSERIAFTDAYFTMIWSKSYQEFINAKYVPVFPNGAHEYCRGKLPAFAETGKKWKIDVDDIYSVLHFGGNHWVALFIFIPNCSIDVFDCGIKGSSNDQIVKAVRPIAHMLPHLLRVSAPTSERAKMSVAQYKIRRPRQGIPQMLKAGDCGIYAIKFIECHALDIKFTTHISDANITMVREKLAVEIFDET